MGVLGFGGFGVWGFGVWGLGGWGLGFGGLGPLSSEHVFAEQVQVIIQAIVSGRDLLPIQF